MVFLWFSDGFPMVFPLKPPFSYGFPMVFDRKRSNTSAPRRFRRRSPRGGPRARPEIEVCRAVPSLAWKYGGYDECYVIFICF